VETVKLLKDDFVCVAVDARTKSYKDADADFMKETNCVAITATGRGVFVTADGKQLGPFNLVAIGKVAENSVKNGLKAWKALPEDDRKPGSVKIKEQGELDPRRADQLPPKGVLVLRVINRLMARTDDGWRYTKTEDYDKSQAFWAPRYAEAANDSLWLKEEEWRKIVPANLDKGAKFAMPEAIAVRFFRHHLEPLRGHAEGGGWPEESVRTGKMSLTVDDVTDALVKLRLEGSAQLRRGAPGNSKKITTFEPALLGYLTWDRKNQKFTRFDVVALGNVTDFLREGAHPLGIAFELVEHPTPADYLMPRGVRDGSAGYFAGPSKAK